MQRRVPLGRLFDAAISPAALCLKRCELHLSAAAPKSHAALRSHHEVALLADALHRRPGTGTAHAPSTQRRRVRPTQHAAIDTFTWRLRRSNGAARPSPTRRRCRAGGGSRSRCRPSTGARRSSRSSRTRSATSRRRDRLRLVGEDGAASDAGTWQLSEDPDDKRDGLWVWGLFEEPLYPFLLVSLDSEKIGLPEGGRLALRLGHKSRPNEARAGAVVGVRRGAAEGEPQRRSVRAVERGPRRGHDHRDGVDPARR